MQEQSNSFWMFFISIFLKVILKLHDVFRKINNGHLFFLLHFQLCDYYFVYPNILTSFA